MRGTINSTPVNTCVLAQKILAPTVPNRARSRHHASRQILTPAWGSSLPPFLRAAPALPTALYRAQRATEPFVSALRVTIAAAFKQRILSASPEAVGPAIAPTAAFLTGLGAAVGPASRQRRRYADAPAAALCV